jgi:multidrug efflux system membrane fusion protein
MLPHTRRATLTLALLVAVSPALGDEKSLEFLGRVEASATVDLRCRVDGYVVAVNCKPGDLVQKGTVLFEIDPRPYKAELERAQAGILQAEARLRYYTVERDRLVALRPTGGVNQSDVDRISAEKLAGEATLHTAKATAELAKLNLEFTRVVAPFAGRIRDPIAAGNVVRADRYTLGTLVADDPVHVLFDVDQKTAMQMRKSPRPGGLPAGGHLPLSAAVQFPGEDGFPHQAKVDESFASADPATGTVRWRIVLPNPERTVLPGMSARVRVALAQ